MVVSIPFGLLLLLLPEAAANDRQWMSLDGDWQFTLLEETPYPGNYTATAQGKEKRNPSYSVSQTEDVVGAGPSSPPSTPLLPPSYCSVLPGSLLVHIISSRRYASPHTTSKH